MNQSSHPFHAARGNRGRACLRLALGSLVLALFAPASFAQTNAAPVRSSNRWLLVVDTSSAMQRRAEAIRRVAATLVLDGMKGQMRSGDSVGLWTYDAELHTGKFKLQTWTPESSRDLARRVFEFLQAQKFEKESRLDRVVPRWNSVISNSAILTIVLISGGEEKISGTPFDDAINDVYEGWREEQEKARMPFLTVLRAEHGRITNQKVNMPPWPLELPALPPESQVVKVPEKSAAPPRLTQPLIFSGRKPATNQTPEVSPPRETGAPPATFSTNSSAPGMEKLSPTLETAPPAASASVAETAKATIPADAANAIVEPATRPADRTGETAATTVAAPPKSETDAPPATKPDGAATSSIRSNVVEARSATPADAIDTATATAAGSSVQGNVIWIGALGLAGVVSVLIWLLLHRSRSTAPASLITRSLDRERK